MGPKHSRLDPAQDEISANDNAKTSDLQIKVALAHKLVSKSSDHTRSNDALMYSQS